MICIKYSKASPSKIQMKINLNCVKLSEKGLFIEWRHHAIIAIGPINNFFYEIFPCIPFNLILYRNIRSIFIFLYLFHFLHLFFRFFSSTNLMCIFLLNLCIFSCCLNEQLKWVFSLCCMAIF